MALLVAILAASALARTGALHENKAREAAAASEAGASAEAGATADDSMVIPDWKLDLVANNGKDWWTKFGNFGAAVVKSAFWGVSQPEITSSPAQDHQRCPVLKLPDTFNAAAKRRSWTSLYGEWNTDNDVNLATWEQSYLSMGFSRNIARVGVHIRCASTGQVAIRTRLFTNEEMLTLFDWKQPAASAKAKQNATNALKEEHNFNLAIFDCMGTLMYVVKERSQFPKLVELFSRDGSLISNSIVGHPVLRYQFVDPKSGYLIATAEAPGINASIKRKDIPRVVKVGGVLPFGFHFEKGGFVNSSALMETEYRWVLAAAVQALAIHKAQAADMPWTIITVVETLLISATILVFLVVFGAAFTIYRCVFPGGYRNSKEDYGELAGNPFLGVPPRPPPRQLLADPAKAGLYSQGGGFHNMALGYGANK